LLLSFAFMHGVSDRLLLTIVSAAPSDVTVMLARFVLVLGTLLLFAIATMIAQMFQPKGSPLVNNAATFAGVTYISLFLSTLIGLRQLFTAEIPLVRGIGTMFQHGLREGTPAFAARVDALGGLTVLAIISTIWICDSGAYYAGRAFGKHKLFERVSPKKTWEGAIGGAVAAVAAMIGMQQWFLPYLTIVDAAVIGAIVGVFGQIGDLAESHLKRDAGVKDSSQLIPGHGGLFDRFDSLLFVAPLVYLYLGFVALR
jgi:phosphatidate cytidylyltransferase